MQRVRARGFLAGPVLIGVALLAIGSTFAENWPQWRGPHGNGVAADTELPTHWSADRNVVWKATLPGSGTSSPIVWGDRVIVTAQLGTTPVRSSHSGGGIADEGAPGVKFVVACLSRADGSMLWQYELAVEGEQTPVHRMHNLASPSPVTDGERIIAWFGTGQVIALDMDGAPIWQRHLAREYSPYDLLWGHASSPVLHGDLLFLLSDHDPAAYLLALDKKTGKTAWKVDRGKGLRSYSTPLVAKIAQREELIVNSNPGLDAYDPASGKHLWHAAGFNKVPVPMPVEANGVIYTSRGYSSGPYTAVRAGGSGDVTDSHVMWRVATGAPYVSSALYYKGLIFFASERGVARAVEPETGESVWVARLGGKFWASPVGAEGRVYLVGEEGETVVIQASRESRILARNSLPGRFVASPAVAGGHMFLRSYDALFCVGEMSTPEPEPAPEVKPVPTLSN